ncbi:hypothetical protein CONPUDRAFT_118786 [Coniophora puteana RWD-64-598 SS2]|uniref:Fe2OG dioxygenase domain-containing protein n=1 Tax=Coniophora puteana (strain RWD-64-598) TaxID=741705 RepID=A0A5M3N389_CONPW|nr:uncharacterized protein CONPUDRAFT_118786 [Coniophora puteana RWD-64-598 SS2]EIW85828.1 hypothetical protein CONPUDRAFT_118786 [Coniophora puteana RWD-64-598 SS2]
MAQQHLHTIQKALETRPAYCSGIHEVNEDFLALYFGKKGSGTSRRIDLAHASDTGLAALASACEPATFGLGEETVLDETYRKAGKLDRTDFATLFNPGDVGISGILHSDLLDSEKDFTMELYKLNVYSEGAFFKPHLDTPRNENMFGSLVVVFPTPHEGGELVLRHGQGESQNEWTVDFSKELAQASSPSVGFVAFFSDVEHEVLPVKAGYRVTLTYNLYFKSKPPPSILAVARPITSIEAQLRSSLSAVVSDPAILPSGGFLAFGLSHKYPLKRGQDTSRVKDYLKGSDDLIARVCSSLALPWSIYVFYKRFINYNERNIFTDRVVAIDLYEYGNCSYEISANQFVTEWFKLRSDGDPSASSQKGPRKRSRRDKETGSRVWKGVLYKEDDGLESDHTNKDDSWHAEVIRMNKLVSEHRVESHFMVYGNEHQLQYVYGSVCLLVELKPSGQRPL